MENAGLSLVMLVSVDRRANANEKVTISVGRIYEAVKGKRSFTMGRFAARRIHVRHCEQVEIEQPIEAHKLCRILISRIQRGHEIVLQYTETESIHC